MVMTSIPETTTKDTSLQRENLESANESERTNSFNSYMGLIRGNGYGNMNCISLADGFLHFNGVLRS